MVLLPGFINIIIIIIIMSQAVVVDRKWILLVQKLCQIVGVVEIKGSTYLRPRALKQHAYAVLQLARRAYRLLEQDRELTQWRDSQTLRSVVLPPRWDKPVRHSSGEATLEAPARAVAKFIFAKSGYALSSAVLVEGEYAYRLDASLFDANGDDGADDDNDVMLAESEDDSLKQCTPSPIVVGPYALNQFYVKDNAIGMEELPDDSFHSIITSTNFNKAGLHRTMTGKAPSSAPLSTKGSWHHVIPFDTCDDDIDEAVYQAQQVSFLKQCRRTLKSGGILFYHHCDRVVENTAHNVEHLFAQAGLNLFRRIFWFQGTSVQQNLNGPTPVVEIIYLLTRDNKTAPRYFKNAVPKQFRSTHWHINKVRSSSHPCVFPPLLVEMCIRLNTKEGDLVLDPHAGSGTVLLTAHNLNRQYLGFDISENYQRAFLKDMDA